METGIQTNQVETTTTQSANPTPAEPQTFTQDDVNRIVAKRVAKYADYDELKQKAAKYSFLAGSPLIKTTTAPTGEEPCK